MTNEDKLEYFLSRLEAIHGEDWADTYFNGIMVGILLHQKEPATADEMFAAATSVKDLALIDIGHLDQEAAATEKIVENIQKIWTEVL